MDEKSHCRRAGGEGAVDALPLGGGHLNIKAGGKSAVEGAQFRVEVEHPQTGKKYKFPGAPVKLSRSPWQVGSHMPKVGEND